MALYLSHFHSSFTEPSQWLVPQVVHLPSHSCVPLGPLFNPWNYWSIALMTALRHWSIHQGWGSNKIKPRNKQAANELWKRGPFLVTPQVLLEPGTKFPSPGHATSPFSHALFLWYIIFDTRVAQVYKIVLLTNIFSFIIDPLLMSWVHFPYGHISVRIWLHFVFSQYYQQSCVFQ